jgi:biopolymer transport protein ExbD
MGAKLGGSGGSRYETSANSDINVTPFVDVMLVLLIIFMVSIPAATVSIKLDLPPAQAPANPTKKTEPVFVSVMGQGDIYIGPRKVPLNQLAAEVRLALLAQNPGANVYEERVLIRGYKDIPYEDFMEVMNELQLQGYSKVGLVNEDIE